jgi:DNA-binding MarR family transcriptional regulator
MDQIEELRFLILGAQREGARGLTALLQDAGLTAAQSEVLAVIRDAGRPLTVREIGERLVCESGSPSRLVSSVVAAGLLARGQRAGDRRAVELSLTPAGKSALRDVAAAEGKLREWLSGTLTAKEREATVRTLRKLVADRPAGAAIARRRAGT